MPCLRLNLGVELGERESPKLQFWGAGKHTAERTQGCCLISLFRIRGLNTELGAQSHATVLKATCLRLGSFAGIISEVGGF